MVQLSIFPGAAVLLCLSALTSAIPQGGPIIGVCTPKLIETTYLTTITSVVQTKTHACYTATTTVRPHFCPINVEVCPPPSCTKTTYTTVPCKDGCCPTTPTATVTKCDLLDHCVFSGCTTVTATTTACL